MSGRNTGGKGLGASRLWDPEPEESYESEYDDELQDELELLGAKGAHFDDESDEDQPLSALLPKKVKKVRAAPDPEDRPLSDLLPKKKAKKKRAAPDPEDRPLSDLLPKKKAAKKKHHPNPSVASSYVQAHNQTFLHPSVGNRFGASYRPGRPVPDLNLNLPHVNLKF